MARDPLIEHLRSLIAATGMIAPGESVVLGVSGGVDSVVLLHALSHLGVACHVVHVNYGLRGADSDADAELVLTLCDQLGASCRIVEPPTGWFEGEASLQEEARNIRYRAFEDEARRRRINKVAVAHHRDDQVETILLRLVRGTGMRGIGGMRLRRPISDGSTIELIRPLLTIAASDIRQWAAEQGIVFREDDSNLDPRFERARMRTSLVPAILEAFGDAGLRNIARSAAHAQSAYDAVVAQRVEADLTAATVALDPPTLSADVLLQFEPGWRRLLLLEAARRWIPDVADRMTTAEHLDQLLMAQTGRSITLKDWVVWKERGTIVFAGSTDPAPAEILVEPGKAIDLDVGTILVERARDVSGDPGQRTSFTFDPNTEWADGAMLAEPLTVRRWRPGDRFQPLGMDGSRKVGDFLTDLKVEPHLKSEVTVLRSGGRIVWVVGHRLAHPFRIRPDSKQVVRLRFRPA